MVFVAFMFDVLGTRATPFIAIILIIIAVPLLAFWLYTRRRIPRGLRLPPGPPGRLIVGNISDMPTEQEWVTYSQWAKEYGDLVYLNVLGRSMLLVNSADMAYELFEKRSSIYSDRSELPMINDLMGWDWNMAFMRYGEVWRSHRRVVHQKLHPAASAEYRPIQLKHSRALLRRLYETPDDFVKHVRHTSGAIIMEFVYGIEVLPKDDPYIATAETALNALTYAGIPGSFLVDILPILKYVPAWFPGADFQRQARKWRKPTVEMNVAPFEAVKQALNSGKFIPSYTSSLLEEMTIKGDASPAQEDVIRCTGSGFYAAGSDTTVIVLEIFFLAMVLFPEAQRKAQEELDAVVGPNRLPEYEDRGDLPYITALCKEVLRWHPISPVGIAHCLSQDDVFGEYFIPSGTIVLGNTWKILHDEATYGADTNKFLPERFLIPGMKDPSAIWGYGRRICPGRYMAFNSIFIAVASILSVYDITHARDSNGKEIPVQAAFGSGFFSRPVPFKCAILPRSDTARTLILSE